MELHLAAREGVVVLKVLVTGSRDWDNRHSLNRTLSKIDQLRTIKTIIVGDARGADEQAAWYGKKVLHCNVKVYEAQWQRQGKRAGYIRNMTMAEENPDIKLCVAFLVTPDPSMTDDQIARLNRGTRSMIAIAEERGIPVVEVHSSKKNERTSERHRKGLEPTP